MKTPDKKAISEELAVEEFTKFLKKYKAKEIRRGQLKLSEIKEQYIDAIEAIQDGFLTFDDKNHPTYRLREQIGDNTDTATTVVDFRTRIRPSDRANVMSGLNVEKDQGKFTLRYIAFITQLPIGELDKMNDDDYDAINQICSVF